MTKRLFILIFSVLAALQLSAQKVYTPASVPNVHLQDAHQFVSNPDGILSQSVVDEINGICLSLKENGIAQVVVLMLDAVDPDDLDLFAHNVLNRWGVGEKGKDNGLVISVVKQQRDIQFETGYGLEGVLPDALCKRIQMTYMVPYLKDDNWDQGVLEGVKAVYNVLTDNQEELGALYASTGNEDENTFPWFGLIFVLLFFSPVALIIVVAGIIYRRQRKCPACHAKNALRQIKRQIVNRTRNSYTVEKTFKCNNCGHVLTRRTTYRTDSGGSGFGGGGSSFGGGSSSGGGGGSFGGGSSGGGGARSSF